MTYSHPFRPVIPQVPGEPDPTSGDVADKRATKTFAERQVEAAVEQARERVAERDRVEKIVFGSRSAALRERMGEIVRLGDDYVVEVIKPGRTTWTFVVNGQSSSWHHDTQERAILHLIAQRRDGNPNSNAHAAFYAGRVLGIPEGEG